MRARAAASAMSRVGGGGERRRGLAAKVVGLVAAAPRKGCPRTKWPGEPGQRGRQPSFLGREQNGLLTLLL